MKGKLTPLPKNILLQRFIIKAYRHISQIKSLRLCELVSDQGSKGKKLQRSVTPKYCHPHKGYNATYLWCSTALTRAPILRMLFTMSSSVFTIHGIYIDIDTYRPAQPALVLVGLGRVGFKINPKLVAIELCFNIC